MKKKLQAPQHIGGPIKIRRESLIAAMRRLHNHPDFAILQSLWLGIRGKILEDGKLKPSEAAWSVLKGFDLAIMEVPKWATMETTEDAQKLRADRLRDSLGELK